MHVDSKCGHVSIVLFGHIVQLGLGVLWAKTFLYFVVTHVLCVSKF